MISANYTRHPEKCLVALKASLVAITVRPSATDMHVTVVGLVRGAYYKIYAELVHFGVATGEWRSSDDDRWWTLVSAENCNMSLPLSARARGKLQHHPSSQAHSIRTRIRKKDDEIVLKYKATFA